MALSISGLTSTLYTSGSTNTASDDNSASYIFPTALKDNGQDYLQFTAYEYQPSTTASLTSTTSGSLASITSASGSAVSGLAGAGANLSGAKGEVFLPIQSGISDSNMVSWGQDELNQIDAQKAATAFNSIQNWNDASDLNNQVAVLNSTISGLIGDATAAGRIAGDFKKEIALYFAGRAANVNNLLARVEGKVLNPNMELLFQGPALRPFSFNFRLSPRDSTEAMQVRNIIRFFKRRMAPQIESGGLFLKAPHVFHIRYMFGNPSSGSDYDNPAINRMKLCALQTCNVDYTPDGNYATFRDGTMTSYGLSLQFTEIVPIYASDYDGAINGQIGY